MATKVRVFLYHGFLSDEECDHLISLALGMKKGSVVGGNASGKIDTINLPLNSYISLNTEVILIGFLLLTLINLCHFNGNHHGFKDELAARIEERISAWIFLPKENSKPLEVLQLGFEEDRESYNYFGNNSAMKSSFPLMATVVLYLSNVSKGGQILFPESESENSRLKSNIWSDCTRSIQTLRPTKGNAILFFNVHLNATPDNSSSHARCPVKEGEMWCATKFFYLKDVREEKVQFRSNDGDCTDEDDNCPRWAAIGECQKNPVFMVGSPDYFGTCRKSCKAC